MPESGNEAVLILFEISHPESDFAAQKIADSLPASLQQHVARYAHPVRRNLSFQLWSVFVLTAEKFGIDPEDLCFDAEGRPVLSCGWISASHTDGSAGLLLAGVPCGLDLEAPDRQPGNAGQKDDSEKLNLERLITRIASPVQIRAISKKKENFYRLWTQKEAQIKLGNQHAQIPIRNLPDQNAEILCFVWNGCFGSLAFEKGLLPDKISVYGYDPVMSILTETEELRFQRADAGKKEQGLYGA